MKFDIVLSIQAFNPSDLSCHSELKVNKEYRNLGAYPHEGKVQLWQSDDVPKKANAACMS